jgi:rhizosphere induced protein
MTDQQAPHYTLRFRNRSGRTLDFLCFQQHPDVATPNIQLLAWFAKPVADATEYDFTWTLTYDFAWREIGHLASEITYQGQEVVPANLEDANHITLTHQDDAFAFGKPMAGDPRGAITILCDNTVPPGEAQVGIGMAGAPVFLVTAEPNMTYEFTPKPEYWITAGTFATGQVIDVSTVAKPVQIVFPPNVDAMTATLDGNGQWTIEQELA